ncbi:hypothetical protein [Pseudodonghicola xiamenensis]|uniref:Uncharacterized protein n=1 Tax=Pseudodonghicola xiamenensis TaxID=337702 RepID=A0A8J3H6W2_9RHOB|nr:hypothetical protein [Pseudodonghicola xiamenensis]GHG85124.1 hypothetical protein GCM10010961_11960 [Pseudodonghicola xiamenensis]
MFRHHFMPAALVLALTTPFAAADEITDALTSALGAYQDGDVKYALEELDYAKQKLTELQVDALAQYLPEAPAGYTREMNTEMSAGMMLMGGGTGAEATYSNEAGDSFTVTLIADNPMVGAMAGMLGNPAAIGAKVERIGRQKMMLQDGEVTGLVDNRILVQAKGEDTALMLEVLKTMDFRALMDFGR